MTAIGLVLIVILVALAIYLIPTMPELLKRVLYAVVIIAFIVWLLTLAGLLNRIAFQ